MIISGILGASISYLMRIPRRRGVASEVLDADARLEPPRPGNRRRNGDEMKSVVGQCQIGFAAPEQTKHPHSPRIESHAFIVHAEDLETVGEARQGMMLNQNSPLRTAFCNV